MTIQTYLDHLESSNLKASSVKTYREKLMGLQRLFESKDFDWILSNPVKVERKLFSQYESLPTRKAHISAVLSLFRHSPGLKSRFPGAHKTWMTMFEKLETEITLKYESNEPSEKQLRNFVSWSDVLKKRKAMERTNPESPEYLLLCLYSMIPPVRADFNNVIIYEEEPNRESVSEAPNYLLVEDFDDAELTKMTLFLNDYKTAGSGPGSGGYKKVFPDALVNVVRDSLNKHPRDYLIVSPRTGEPFRIDNSYIKYANQLLAKIFHPKKPTLSLLRHSFISQLDQNNLTVRDRKEIAKDMMHSVDQQSLYAFVFNKNKKCRCVCTDDTDIKTPAGKKP